ncbi:hypothetical protein PZ938_00310 [Luteipulveratus sp. YIM 133132]|uniref:RiboL-PSP-HEPN domain-containing protein n=1 Tax=Luteipulveratus flavus TaxID=3031728 RepID=A0ABT6C3K1_9MICO|nr:MULTISPECIES: HEPN domain-containing protein [unclassified Luteipulveratus]MDE9364036.1 hypothetical protein [Luteipulveratus sp. YIM 133132]MDF8263539.1 hypothetical protein [Luteipulveratus sp. YIM 133296]
MSSPPLAVFERLMQQVDQVRAAANREVQAGHETTGPVLLRSALVLTVAAFDTFIHERAIGLLRDHAAKGATEAQLVATYLRGGTTEFDVSSGSAELFIRYRLSYRTLVSPDKIDEVLAAAGVDATHCWLHASIAMGSRPDRVRAQLQLQYDRRNQIAHEGDWDPVALDFRSLGQAHIEDCVNHVVSVVNELNGQLP